MDAEKPALLDVVALLTDVAAQRLARGHVGTVVEEIDNEILLVEFSRALPAWRAGRRCRAPRHCCATPR
jgi:uncharacterized protein DUF4926